MVGLLSKALPKPGYGNGRENRNESGRMEEEKKSLTFSGKLHMPGDGKKRTGERQGTEKVKALTTRQCKRDVGGGEEGKKKGIGVQVRHRRKLLTNGFW